MNYDPLDLLPVWDLFIGASNTFKNSDGFEYDLVDLTRQVLANYALPVQQQMAITYRNNDKEAFKKHSQELLMLISDLDRLLATRKDFLLGPWIADARSWGTTPEEKALYERNARNLITLWGGPDNPLHEYSCRQWSGVLNDFYKPRWQQFITDVEAAWGDFNQEAFDEKIKQWEWNWVNKEESYPTQPSGNTYEVAKELHAKYRSKIDPITKIMPPIDYNY